MWPVAEAHGDASKEVRQGRVQCGSHSVAVKTVVQLLSSLVWKMVSATNSPMARDAIQLRVRD